MYFSGCHFCCFFFFFSVAATSEIYTLSLHDALPICGGVYWMNRAMGDSAYYVTITNWVPGALNPRSEEHTSELQSRQYLVCRLLLEKKKKKTREYHAAVFP